MRVAIIGAGFSGLSTAWYLLQSSHCEVTVFDKKAVGAGASGIAAGLIHPYVGNQARRSAFATEAMAATKELITVAEPYVKKKIILHYGIIRHIHNEEQRQRLLSHCQAFGDMRLYQENSFWIDSGMTIDCPCYLEGLWLACNQKGARLMIEEIQDLNSLTCDFNHVVIAAGAGSKQFAETECLQLSLIKGQLLKCKVPKTVQLPKTSSLGRGYVALSESKSTCMIGSTYQRGDFSDCIQPDLAKEELFPKVALFFPAVIDLEVVECYAALRVTRSGHYLPIATRMKDNIWALTAMGSRGLLYHAYFGKTLANEILSL
jgi:glycine/D-amino acid oxidase-like deaminating enzyme